MGAGVLDALANNPLNAQRQSDSHEMTQAQLPGVQAQGQLAQDQAQQAQIQLRDNQVFSDAFRNSGGDWGKTMTAIMKDPRGISPQGYLGLQNDHLKLQQGIATLSKDQYEAQKPMLEQHGQILQSAMDAGAEGTPERQSAAAQAAQQLGVDPKTLLTDNGIKMAMAANNYYGQSITNAKTKQESATSAATQAKTEAEIPGEQAGSVLKQQEAKAAQSFASSPQAAYQQIDTMFPKDVPGNATPNLRYKSMLDFYIGKGDFKGAAGVLDKANAEAGDIAKQTNPQVQQQRVDTAVAQAKATQPIKIELAQQEAAARAQAGLSASGLGDDDFKRLGQQYHDTGVMPPMGMGNAAVRGRILHESNQIAAQNGESPADVTAQQTIYQTGKMDLSSQQKLYSQVKGFEDTAGQNLDRALKTAGTIVDSGSPLFNAPIRSIAGKLGSDQQAAFNAAITTAQNEVARVLNSATASGGVVSDHSKEEVTSMLSGNYSLSQLQSAANILRQDMHTRTGAIQQQIQEQQKRMLPGQTKTPAGASYAPEADSNRSGNSVTPGPLPATLGSSDVGKVYTNRTGQRIKITAVNPNNPKQFRSEVQQ